MIYRNQYLRECFNTINTHTHTHTRTHVHACTHPSAHHTHTNYQSRSASALCIPQIEHRCGGVSPLFTFSLLWNSLPPSPLRSRQRLYLFTLLGSKWQSAYRIPCKKRGIGLFRFSDKPPPPPPPRRDSNNSNSANKQQHTLSREKCSHSSGSFAIKYLAVDQQFLFLL